MSLCEVASHELCTTGPTFIFIIIIKYPWPYILYAVYIVYYLYPYDPLVDHNIYTASFPPPPSAG